jgi:hypothetical protein
MIFSEAANAKLRFAKSLTTASRFGHADAAPDIISRTQHVLRDVCPITIDALHNMFASSAPERHTGTSSSPSVPSVPNT